MSITGAYMVPHPPVIMAEVGRGEEKKIQKTIDAFTEVGRRIGNLRPDTIIVTSPHAHAYVFELLSDFKRKKCARGHETVPRTHSAV